MKPLAFILFALPGVAPLVKGQEANPYFTNFIRQIQVPSGVERDVSVSPLGQRKSELGIDQTGSQFELWTVRLDPMKDYLLDTKYVGAYVPNADIVIQSEDPYQSEGVYRTRADRPFTVVTTVANLLSDPTAPEAAKKVTYLHHHQSYGPGGRASIDPSQASEYGRKILTRNRQYPDVRVMTVLPGGDVTKVWGEERFSVYSWPDGDSPASEIVSKTIEILPVSRGSIAGISEGELVRFRMPQVTFSAADIYPNENVSVFLYKGPKRTDGGVPEEATRLPIGFPNTRETPWTPDPHTPNEGDWTGLITEDGIWTLELWAENPYFGNDLLDSVTFDYESALRVNSLVGAME